MSWWWAGAIGAAKKKLEDDSTASDPLVKHQSVGLLIGAATIVGASLAEILPLADTPGGPWKLYAVSADNNINSSSNLPVERIPCNVSDPADALAKLSPLADVTHLFHLSPDPAALSNVLSAILPSAANLQHVCLVTGQDHYLGSEPPFHEELPRRLDSLNPNYHLEDILLDELSKPENSVTWSVHRPSTLFGFSPSGKSNLVSTLCVYASICRKEGAFLRFPGTRVAWEGYSNASDADLVAEHQIWAAVDQYAKNEAFNCSNGDVFKWKQLWPMLAEQFGIGWVGYEGEEARFKLAEAMEGKRGLWEEMVAEHELVPSRLEEVGDWEFTDAVLNVEESCLHSMNKSKEHGFFGFRNTMPSFESWIDKTQMVELRDQPQTSNETSSGTTPVSEGEICSQVLGKRYMWGLGERRSGSSRDSSQQIQMLQAKVDQITTERQQERETFTKLKEDMEQRQRELDQRLKDFDEWRRQHGQGSGGSGGSGGGG